MITDDRGRVRRALARAKEAHPPSELRARVRSAPPPRPPRIRVEGELRLIPAPPSTLPPEPTVRLCLHEGAAALAVREDSPLLSWTPRETAVELPLLRQDLVIDEYQIWETRALLADAMVFDAAVLERNQLFEYLHLACELGLTPVIQADTEAPLETALRACESLDRAATRAALLFALPTGEVHPRSLEPFIRRTTIIPPARPIVVEARPRSRADTEALQGARADAALWTEPWDRPEELAARLREVSVRPREHTPDEFPPFPPHES
ncbi:MAG: hypothetical protein HY716_09500 [Planctomycetes bacterium]|nr:hypothetical protein [Planctomycetota bacterium]